MSWRLRLSVETILRLTPAVLGYFASGLTNGRTEGFNNKAKVVKRRAYGYRLPKLSAAALNACA
ncbi:MAG TPA: transposase [Blastocatellia bacterium]|nr:transposase [Blastocatellia bacterium]